MKKFMLLFIILLSSSMFAQNLNYTSTDNFVPKTLYAGTEMSARTVSSTMSDTTKSFTCRGYQAVYVGLESATNDSLQVYLAYRISKDGSTYNAFTLLDSLSVSGTVGVANYISLPAKCMGAYDVQLRVYGNALTGGNNSANPSATLKTYIVRVKNSATKIK
jgi:hypothetical protein